MQINQAHRERINNRYTKSAGQRAAYHNRPNLENIARMATQKPSCASTSAQVQAAQKPEHAADEPKRAA
jgi:hypothetical protein